MSGFKQDNLVLDPGKKIIFNNDYGTPQSSAAYSKAISDATFLGRTSQANDSAKLGEATLSTDATLLSNSDSEVPSQKAGKTYLDSKNGCYCITLCPNDILYPSANLDYYFGKGIVWNIYGLGIVRIPKEGYIKSVTIAGLNNGTNSGEAVKYILVVNTTNYLISSIITDGFWSAIKELSIHVTNSDYVLIKVSAPTTWTTPPLSIHANALVYIEF